MRFLDQVMAAGGGHALNLRQSVKHGEFPNRRPLCLELVHVEGHWDVVIPQQTDKKSVGGFRVTVSRRQNIGDGPGPIHRPLPPVVNPSHGDAVP